MLHTSRDHNLLAQVDLSTLNDVPAHSSGVLGFRGASMHISLYQPPAGWSVAPCNNSRHRLVFSRNGSECVLLA